MTSVEEAGDRRDARLRTAVTVLISIASLLGALTAWRLTQLGSEAGGADGRAVSETSTRERDRSRALVVAQEEAAAFTRAQGYVTAVATFARRADEAAGTGDLTAAGELRATAQTLQDLANDLLARFPAIGNEEYVTGDPAEFAVERRRSDLEAQLQRPLFGGSGTPHPERAVAEAEAAHDDALALAAVVLAFAVAIFLLALAEKLRERVVPLLASAGAVVLVGALIGAVVLW